MIYCAIEAKGFVGVYKGLKQRTLKLEFNENGFNVFTGKNGSGKTTIMRLLTPFAEDKDELMVAGENERGNTVYEPAHKKLWVKDKQGNIFYILHTFTTSGTKRCFVGLVDEIWSEDVAEGDEHNPNGNVTSFAAAIEEIFGITPNKIDGIITTTEANSFLDMKSVDRKKSIASLIPDVSEYLVLYKHVRENIRSINGQIQYIVEDTKSFGGSRESLLEVLAAKKQVVENLEDGVKQATAALNKVRDSRSMIQGQLQGMIINGTNTIEETRNHIARHIEELNKRIKTLEEKAPSMEGITVADVKNRLLQLRNAANAVNEDLQKSMEESRKISDEIHRETSRVNSLNNIESSKELLKLENERISEAMSRFSVDPADKEFFDANVHLYPTYEREITLLRSLVTFLNRTETQVKDKFDEFYADGGINKESRLVSNYARSMKESYEAINSSINETRGNINSYRELINSAPNFKKMGCDIDNCTVEFIDKIDAGTIQLKHLEESLTKIIDKAREIEPVANFENTLFDSYSSLINNGDTISSLLNSATVRGKELATIMTRIDDIQRTVNTANQEKRQLEILVESRDKRAKAIEDMVAVHNATYPNVVSGTGLSEELKAKRSDIDKVIAEKGLEGKRIAREIDRVETEELGYLEEMSSIDHDKQTVEKLHRDLSNLSKLSSDYDALDAEWQSLELDLNIRERNLKMEKEGALPAIEHSIKMYDHNTKRLEELNKTLNLNEMVSQALHPAKGIPNIISNEKLFIIENDCNEILGNYFDGRFSVKFENSESELEILVFSSYTGITSYYNNMSAGERSIIKLVLSVVLMQHRIDSNLDAIMLDEIDSFLDEENRNSFELLLDTLKEDKGISQIFIISHNIRVAGSSFFFDKENHKVVVT